MTIFALSGSRLRTAALPALAALLVGCDSDSTIVGVNAVAVDMTITVESEVDGPATPSVDTLELAVGETASLAVVATNALGLAVGGIAVSWSSSDTGVADVAQDGTVTALSAGSAEIGAVAGDVSASLPVVVTSPPAP
jgi:hypothetical protein